MVSALKNDLTLKTTIGEGAELGLSIWHSGVREACLMHVGVAIDVIRNEESSRPTKKLMISTQSNMTW
jgi:hypothetical protein